MKDTNIRPVLDLKVAEYTLKNSDRPGTHLLVLLRAPLSSVMGSKSVTKKAKVISKYGLPLNLQY